MLQIKFVIEPGNHVMYIKKYCNSNCVAFIHTLKRECIVDLLFINESEEKLPCHQRLGRTDCQSSLTIVDKRPQVDILRKEVSK